MIATWYERARRSQDSPLGSIYYLDATVLLDQEIDPPGPGHGLRAHHPVLPIRVPHFDRNRLRHAQPLRFYFSCSSLHTAKDSKAIQMSGHPFLCFAAESRGTQRFGARESQPSIGETVDPGSSDLTALTRFCFGRRCDWMDVLSGMCDAIEGRGLPGRLGGLALLDLTFVERIGAEAASREGDTCGAHLSSSCDPKLSLRKPLVLRWDCHSWSWL